MRSRKLSSAFVLAFLFASAFCTTVFAHGRTQVGDYELVIGFRNEPAYQGEPNGLDLVVTNTATNEPVIGLEETLQVEVIYGASKRELPLRARFGQDGAYTADILPTEAGDYTWHIWGDLEETPVDVMMTSSPDTFGSVEPKTEFSFPAAEPTTQELRDQTRLALLFGILGTVLGVIGMIVGFLGMRARRT